MKETMFYAPLPKGGVRCNLCNHRCKIKEGKRGICSGRENRGGKLYSLVYGKIIAEHIDPIEKKPLFNFLPSSKAFSIGTVGCNFQCKHCQNFDISQYPREHRGEIIGQDRTPEQIVMAVEAAGCESCFRWIEKVQPGKHISAKTRSLYMRKTPQEEQKKRPGSLRESFLLMQGQPLVALPARGRLTVTTTTADVIRGNSSSGLQQWW